MPSGGAAVATAPARVYAAPVLLDTPRGPVQGRLDRHGPAVLALHGGMGGYDQSLLVAQALGATPAQRSVPGAEWLAIPQAGHVALFTHLAAIRARAARFLLPP